MNNCNQSEKLAYAKGALTTPQTVAVIATNLSLALLFGRQATIAGSHADRDEFSKYSTRQG